MNVYEGVLVPVYRAGENNLGKGGGPGTYWGMDKSAALCSAVDVET